MNHIWETTEGSKSLTFREALELLGYDEFIKQHPKTNTTPDGGERTK